MDPQDIPLRDIHMPNLISWWPLASGWWVLLGVVVATVTIAGAIGWWRKRHRVRRAALREFSDIEKNFGLRVKTLNEYADPEDAANLDPLKDVEIFREVI